MMKMKFCIVIMIVGTLLSQQPSCKAESFMRQEDSKALQLQDLLMVYLSEFVEEDINNYYKKYISGGVTVYPYDVNFIKIDRLNGFRGYDFKVIIEAYPVVGAHNSIGKDRLTYQISFLVPRKAKLLKYEHIETYEIPSNLQID